MGEKPFFDSSIKKERWDPKTKNHVEVEEDEHFKKRIEYLRNQSNDLNRSLQSKLEKTGLPYYSWNKSSKKESGQTNEITYPKVLRLAVLLRPEFYHSLEQKNNQTRYSSGDDQGTLFLHLTPDNQIQQIRFHSGFSQDAYGIYFIHDLLKKIEQDKKEIEEYLQNEDIESLSEYITKRFIPSNTESDTYTNKMTEFYKKAYEITSVEDAKKYFDQEDFVLYQPKELIRNLAKIVITKILETTLQENLDQKKQRSDLEIELRKAAGELLETKVCSLDKNVTIASFLPENSEYIKQTIYQLLKIYKPKILGWQKKV